MQIILVLMAIFLLWRCLERRRSKPEKTHWDRIPPTEYARRDFAVPPIREQIDSCYQDQEAYLRDRQAHTKRKDQDELLTLLYTPGRMYRAALFRDGRLYRVEYENLRLENEEELYWSHTAGAPCGWWEDGGESWFDDPASAEETARSVLRQLEGAEREALTGADLPG